MFIFKSNRRSREWFVERFGKAGNRTRAAAASGAGAVLRIARTLTCTSVRRERVGLT
jgi:hypothetical protein